MESQKEVLSLPKAQYFIAPTKNIHSNSIYFTWFISDHINPHGNNIKLLQNSLYRCHSIKYWMKLQNGYIRAAVLVQKLKMQNMDFLSGILRARGIYMIKISYIDLHFFFFDDEDIGKARSLGSNLPCQFRKNWRKPPF